MSNPSDTPSVGPDDSIVLPHPGRLTLWLLAGFLLCAAAMIALPHQPYIRYQALSETIHNRVQWSYERVHFDPTPIDVAVIGNSRMGAGINAPALGAALSERLGRQVHVVNLSTPQEGRNLHWTVLRDLLETRPEVSLVLLSVIEQEPRTGHPAFHNLAEADDILTAPPLINKDWLPDIAFLPYRQVSLFVQSLLPGAFGMHRDFDAAAYSGPDFDTTVPFYLPDGRRVNSDIIPPEPELRRAAEQRIAGISRPMLPDSLKDYEFVVERSYIRESAALAREHGVDLAFVYLPVYANDGEINNLAFYEEIGPVFQARQLINAAELFADYGHLGTVGALALVPWLADVIAASVAAGDITLKPVPPEAAQP